MNKRTASLGAIHAREDGHLQRCLEQGVAARKAGQPLSANPAVSVSWRRAWAEGWTRENNRLAAQVSTQ